MDNKSVSSRLRDLVKFLSSVQGDLANITAPPFFLAPTSVVEAGNCWAERPAAFVAPALEPDPQRRSLLVLRLVLIALRRQLYIGGSPQTSIRKPLNAFLGEVFLASWTAEDSNDGSDGSDGNSISSVEDEAVVVEREPKPKPQSRPKAKTQLVAEQVSHHPPITAMHIRDTEHGVRADGYARVEMTFGPAGVDVRQVGHAVMAIDSPAGIRDSYLIPLPAVKVRGFLAGRLYPEVQGGPYHIVSESGFITELRFSGAGLVWGRKNGFTARIYQRDDAAQHSLYDVEGVWSEGWTVRDSATGAIVERYEVDAPENAPATECVAPLGAQDPWESRRAWHGVREGLERGDFRATVAEKTRVEQAQRKMRAAETRASERWEPLLFRSMRGADHDVFHRLTEGLDWKLQDGRTKGVWVVDEDKLAGLQKPYRGDLTPFG